MSLTFESIQQVLDTRLEHINNAREDLVDNQALISQYDYDIYLEKVDASLLTVQTLKEDFQYIEFINRKLSEGGVLQ